MEASEKTVVRTPRGQGNLLRDRLIDAALELLDGGQEPAGISIRGVTRRAGVSPTAFYLQFEDRQELMRALLDRGFTGFRERMRRGADQGDSPWDRLMGAGSAYIAFAREQPERYRLIFAADWGEHGIEDDPDQSLEAAEGAFTDLVELIADCVGPEDAPSPGLDTLAIGVWSGLHGYVTLCHAQPKMAALTETEYMSLLARAWLGSGQE
jgi:AcrR family transcriptional regulator